MKIVACFLEYHGKFLILLRASDKPNGATWGLPAGKIDADESPEDAMLREIFEETGYRAETQNLEHVAHFDFGKGASSYDVAVYRVALDKKIDVKINPSEHREYLWVTPQECYALPNLILDFHEALERLGYIQ